VYADDWDFSRQCAYAMNARRTPVRNRNVPYMPGKNYILSLATKGVREAANGITLDDYQG
jgi:hypothetical protein